MSCLIVFRSMTQVQYAASVLRRKQIRVSITRPPLAAGKGSCSAALQITEVDLVASASLLNKLSFRPLAYYRINPDGSFREVFP
jgi:hypothetical protein